MLGKLGTAESKSQSVLQASNAILTGAGESNEEVRCVYQVRALTQDVYSRELIINQADEVQEPEVCAPGSRL